MELPDWWRVGEMQARVSERVARLNDEIIAARVRIRAQIRRIRAAQLEGGDVVLSLCVLTHLRKRYSDLVWLKRETYEILGRKSISK